MKIFLVDPTVTGITGTEALKAEEVALDLPKDVIALGTKRWIDASQLSFIRKTRMSIARVMRKYGLGFGSVYIVPQDRLEAAKNELHVLQSEFNQNRAELAGSVDAHVDAWAIAHPEWSEKIRAAALSPAEIERRIQFTVRDYPIEVDAESGASPEMFDGLEGQLAQEIAAEVKDGWSGSAKQSVNRRFTRVLDRIKDKVKSLEWVAPDLCAGVTASIAATLDSLPKTGKIEGADYIRLDALMTYLSDPAKLLRSAGSIEAEPIGETATDVATKTDEPKVEPATGASWAW